MCACDPNLQSIQNETDGGLAHMGVEFGEPGALP